MAWGKEVDPKEIIGMTPEELSGRLGKIESVESKMVEFAGKQDKTDQTLQSILQKLEERAKTRETSDPDLDFLANPSDAVNTRLKPLEQQTAENTVMLQHRIARETYPTDFNRWGTEIVTKMGELDIRQQADLRVWTAMVMMVRGMHAADLEKDGATGKFGYLEPVSAGLRPDPKASDGLSNAEREMVRTLSPFGMTPEKYAKGKGRLEKARAARLGRFAEIS